MVKRKNNLQVSTLIETLSSYFYSDTNRIQRVRPYLEKTSNISLRLIDWYVSVYVKNNPVLLHDNTFDISNSHSLHLKSYSKRLFDPFQRNECIRLHLSDSDYIDTTISQLNFFKWASQNGVLDHIENNVGDIQKLFQEKKEIKAQKRIKQASKKTKKQQKGEPSIERCL